MKNLHTKKTDRFAMFKNVGIFSSALFIAASAVYIYSPTFGSHAAESQEAQVSLTVSSTLGIRTSANNLNLEANVGDFVHGSIDVDVITNSQYGYTLTLEDSDNEASLIHTNSSVEDKLISSFLGAKTSSAMDDNTWGFSLDESSYYFIPTLGNPVALKRTNSVHSGYDTTAVGFGAKVGASLTAGTYTDTVKFTAYVNGVDGNPTDPNPNDPSNPTNPVNPSEPGEESSNGGNSSANATLFTIANMQDLTVDVCEAATTPLYTATLADTDGSHAGDADFVPTATLRDVRDGNEYTVKKLADGRCWMTDNLRIINRELNGTTSNIPAGETFTIPESDKTKFHEQDDENNAYLDENEAYGGYYSFYTATAGWGTISVNAEANAPKDICPKGWRLPTGTGNGEYAELVNYYSTKALLKDGAPSFVYSASVRARDVWDQGNFGLYWTATTAPETYFDYAKRAYYFETGNSGIYTTSKSEKSYGFTIRCIDNR